MVYQFNFKRPATPLLKEEGGPKGGVVAHKSCDSRTDHPGASRHPSCVGRGVAGPEFQTKTQMQAS